MKRWSHKDLDLEHHCIANQYIKKQNHQQVNVPYGIVDSVPDLCAVEWGSNPKLGGSCSRTFWALISISMLMVNVTNCYDGVQLIVLLKQYTFEFC